MFAFTLARSKCLGLFRSMSPAKVVNLSVGPWRYLQLSRSNVLGIVVIAKKLSRRATDMPRREITGRSRDSTWYWYLVVLLHKPYARADIVSSSAIVVCGCTMQLTSFVCLLLCCLFLLYSLCWILILMSKRLRSVLICKSIKAFFSLDDVILHLLSLLIFTFLNIKTNEFSSGSYYFSPFVRSCRFFFAS